MVYDPAMKLAQLDSVLRLTLLANDLRRFGANMLQACLSACCLDPSRRAVDRGVIVLSCCVLVVGCGDISSSTTTDTNTTTPSSTRLIPNTIAEHSSLVPNVKTTSICFRDITSSSGLQFTYKNSEQSGHYAILESLGGGIGIIDFDADGSLDLVIPAGGAFSGENKVAGVQTGLFRNTGRFSYVDSSTDACVGRARVYTHGAAVGDIDNDGFSDFILTGYGGLHLYLNMGDGSFTESAMTSGITDTLWSSSAAIADFNSDGAPDIYVSHYVNWSLDNNPVCPDPSSGKRDVCPPRDFSPLADLLYLNSGEGRFVDASSSWNLRVDGKGLGVLAGDVDLDGDVDIYVSNDTTANFLYRNTGQQFEDIGMISSTAMGHRGTANGSMGSDLGDFDNDGLPDLWVTNYEREVFALYRNSGAHYFQPVSQDVGIAGIDALYVGWGTAFLDADRDGDLDIFCSNGHVIRHPVASPVRQLPLLLENHSGSKFQNVAPAAGDYTSLPHKGRGLAVGDLDNDGDLDVTISHVNEPVAILENRSLTDHDWIGFQLIGRQCSRDAVGASVRLQLDDGSLQIRQVNAGGSYASSSGHQLFFGLAAHRIRHASVSWPSGAHSHFDDLSLRRVHTLIEPKSSR
jgi:enediyne biosynthesis protein E4